MRLLKVHLEIGTTSPAEPREKKHGQCLPRWRHCVILPVSKSNMPGLGPPPRSTGAAHQAAEMVSRA